MDILSTLSVHCTLHIIHCELQYAVGWSDFWRKLLGHSASCVWNCFWTPIPKCYILMLLFNLAQGLWKCWLLPLNGQNFVKNLLSLRQGVMWLMSSLGLLEAKYEEKVYKKIAFLWPFIGITNIAIIHKNNRHNS